MSFRFLTVYQVSVGDDLGSASYWNARFQDIDLRLNAVEQYSSTIDSTVATVTDQALAQVTTLVDPYINSLESQINGLSTQVSALNNSVLTDQANVTSQLNALLAQGQTLVDNLSSLGALSDGTF